MVEYDDEPFLADRVLTCSRLIGCSATLSEPLRLIDPPRFRELDLDGFL